MLPTPRQLAAALVETVNEAQDEQRDPVDAVLAELAEFWLMASQAYHAATESDVPLRDVLS